MPEPIGRDVVFGTFAFLSSWLGGVEDTVDLVLDASAAWPLPVALDFPASASNTGIGRSAWDFRRGSKYSLHGF